MAVAGTGLQWEFCLPGSHKEEPHWASQSFLCCSKPGVNDVLIGSGEVSLGVMK